MDITLLLNNPVTIHRLPTELLNRIFHSCVDRALACRVLAWLNAATEMRYLSQVCRYWRGIVNEDPILWGKAINLKTLEECPSRWLRVMLFRSGSDIFPIASGPGVIRRPDRVKLALYFLPKLARLKISINQNMWNGVGQDGLTEDAHDDAEIDDMYVDENNNSETDDHSWTVAEAKPNVGCVERWKHWTEDESDEGDILLNMLANPAPHLKLLAVQINRQEDEVQLPLPSLPTPLLGDDAPQLRRLAVQNCHFDTRALVLCNLTYLEVSHPRPLAIITVSNWIQLLERLPRLTDLRIYGSLADATATGVAFATISLPDLSLLAIDGPLSAAGGLLSCLDIMPSCSVDIALEDRFMPAAGQLESLGILEFLKKHGSYHVDQNMANISFSISTCSLEIHKITTDTALGKTRTIMKLTITWSENNIQPSILQDIQPLLDATVKQGIDRLRLHTGLPNSYPRLNEINQFLAAFARNITSVRELHVTYPESRYRTPFELFMTEIGVGILLPELSTIIVDSRDDPSLSAVNVLEYTRWRQERNHPLASIRWNWLVEES